MGRCTRKYIKAKNYGFVKHKFSLNNSSLNSVPCPQASCLGAFLFPETDYKESSEIRKRLTGFLEMKNDANKLFGDMRKSYKIMFPFVAFFLQISCESL